MDLAKIHDTMLLTTVKRYTDKAFYLVTRNRSGHMISAFQSFYHIIKATFMSTETVLNHHLEGFSNGDVDAVMEDFTEGSVLILPDTTLTDLASIRAAFTEFFGGLFKPGTYELILDRMEISGDVAYIVWHSTNQGMDIKLGTDTLVVRNGKIAVQTFAAFMQEK